MVQKMKPCKTQTHQLQLLPAPNRSQESKEPQNDVPTDWGSAPPAELKMENPQSRETFKLTISLARIWWLSYLLLEVFIRTYIMCYVRQQPSERSAKFFLRDERNIEGTCERGAKQLQLWASSAKDQENYLTVRATHHIFLYMQLQSI